MNIIKPEWWKNLSQIWKLLPHYHATSYVSLSFFKIFVMSVFFPFNLCLFNFPVTSSCATLIIWQWCCCSDIIIGFSYDSAHLYTLYLSLLKRFINVFLTVNIWLFDWKVLMSHMVFKIWFTVGFCYLVISQLKQNSAANPPEYQKLHHQIYPDDFQWINDGNPGL